MLFVGAHASRCVPSHMSSVCCLIQICFVLLLNSNLIIFLCLSYKLQQQHVPSSIVLVWSPSHTQPTKFENFVYCISSVPSPLTLHH